MIRARVVVASNRAAAGVYADTSGPLLVVGLRELGCQVDEPVVVPDGEPVGEALRAARADGIDVVLTSGGTGINPTDRTPEVTRALLDHEIPGIAEAIRAYSRDRVPTSALSRGSPGCWAGCSWSTCPARGAARRTGWPCSGRSSATRSTSCAAATTDRTPGAAAIGSRGCTRSAASRPNGGHR